MTTHTAEEPAIPAVGGRRRTRRACDSCSSLRARCDGRQPCRRCEEYSRSCNYARHVAKRGRKPGSGQNGNGQPRPSLPLQNGTVRGRESVGYDTPSEVDHDHSHDHNSALADIIITNSVSGPEPYYWGYREGPSPHAPSSDGPSPHSATEASPSHQAATLLATLPGSVPAVVPTVPAAILPDGHRVSFSTPQRPPPLQSSTRTTRPRFACLEPLLPRLDRIIDADLASELLHLYFVEPGGSLFQCASPYILTRVLRRSSVLRQHNPRRTSPALLVTMLWTSAQAADSLFLLPSQKARVCADLKEVMMQLIKEHDENRDKEGPQIDDVLVFVLISIVVSGGDSKTECFMWWDKALRLARSLGLNREDVSVGDDSSDGDNIDSAAVLFACSRHVTCQCRPCMATRLGLSVAEVQEENRRMFWLLFCLDRHLCLSFNSPLAILDDECQLYRPLPDAAWESMPDTEMANIHSSQRLFGPPTVATGTGFFEYFLPLMTILGDVILLHRQKCHPRFGRSLVDETEMDEDQNHTRNMALVESVLDDYARSLADLDPQATSNSPHASSPESFSASSPSQAQLRLVTAYSTFILHVLHVLLHGKWDAVSMLENKDGWISSTGFNKCATHSIAASDAVSRILRCDPELAFMPYLFGIYLLHGSFILLLFADRMPQVGLNESVERACETIIRAHEVCVVTLNTEFQKQFRKALRSTLNSVRNVRHDRQVQVGNGSHVDEGQARRRALSLYRWSRGFTGLAV